MTCPSLGWVWSTRQYLVDVRGRRGLTGHQLLPFPILPYKAPSAPPFPQSKLPNPFWSMKILLIASCQWVSHATTYFVFFSNLTLIAATICCWQQTISKFFSRKKKAFLHIQPISMEFQCQLTKATFLGRGTDWILSIAYTSLGTFSLILRCDLKNINNRS